MGLHKERGVWVATLQVCGVRFRKSLGVRHKEEAKRLYYEFEKQAKEGLLVANPTNLQKLTFAEVLRQWLDDRARGIGRLDKPPLAEKTKRTEQERARIVSRELGHLKVSAIQPAAIERFVEKRREGGVSNGTINRELDLIRGTLRKADRPELAVRCRNLPLGESIGRAFSPDEKARLIAAASRLPERRHARLALILALNTSLRPAEMRSLQWKDVDLLDEVINLRISKTKAGKRTVPLNGDALAALLELEGEAKKFCEHVDQRSFVFFCQQGEADVYKPVKGWRTAWRSIVKEAGVARCRFYDSRHTVVTELLQDPNVSEETVKSMVGHVSRKMLERYSHQRIGPKRAAVLAPTFGTQNIVVPTNFRPSEEENKKPN